MNEQDVIAAAILREVEKKERLMKIINQSTRKYLVVAVIFGVVYWSAGLIFLYILRKIHVPALNFAETAGMFVVGQSLIIAIMEGVRLKERFDALIELLEIERQERKPNQPPDLIRPMTGEKGGGDVGQD